MPSTKITPAGAQNIPAGTRASPRRVDIGTGQIGSALVDVAVRIQAVQDEKDYTDAYTSAIQEMEQLELELSDADPETISSRMGDFQSIANRHIGSTQREQVQNRLRGDLLPIAARARTTIGKVALKKQNAEAKRSFDNTLGTLRGSAATETDPVRRQAIIDEAAKLAENQVRNGILTKEEAAAKIKAFRDDVSLDAVNEDIAERSVRDGVMDSFENFEKEYPGLTPQQYRVAKEMWESQSKGDLREAFSAGKAALRTSLRSAAEQVTRDPFATSRTVPGLRAQAERLKVMAQDATDVQDVIALEESVRRLEFVDEAALKLRTGGITGLNSYIQGLRTKGGEDANLKLQAAEDVHRLLSRQAAAEGWLPTLADLDNQRLAPVMGEGVDMVAGFQQRAEDAKRLSEKYGVTTGLLSKEELSAFVGRITENAHASVPLLSAMAASLDMQAQTALRQQLQAEAKNLSDKDAALVVASGIEMAGNSPQLALIMLSGNQTRGRLGADLAINNQVFNTAVSSMGAVEALMGTGGTGANLPDPVELSTTLSAAKALYYGLYPDKLGDNTDSTLAENAIILALNGWLEPETGDVKGGPDSFNGVETIFPYGVTRAEFSELVERLTDADLVKYGSGVPIPDTLERVAGPLKAEDFSEAIWMRLADGRYAVRSASGGILKQENGDIWPFDFDAYVSEGRSRGAFVEPEEFLSDIGGS